MGNLNITLPRDKNAQSVNDPLSIYKISDQDETTDPKYFGFVAHNGAYYIQKWSVSGQTFRYYAGMGDYVTKWAARVSLPYDMFDTIF